MAGRKPGPAAASAGGPEHWRAEVRGQDLAQLDIPAHASRERTFELFCSFVVTSRDEGAFHGLRVLVDGAQHWTRRVSTAPGPSDSLEVRLRRTVAVGAPLRITAIGSTVGAVPIRLSISADED